MLAQAANWDKILQKAIFKYALILPGWSWENFRKEGWERV